MARKFLLFYFYFILFHFYFIFILFLFYFYFIFILFLFYFYFILFSFSLLLNVEFDSMGVSLVYDMTKIWKSFEFSTISKHIPLNLLIIIGLL